MAGIFTWKTLHNEHKILKNSKNKNGEDLFVIRNIYYTFYRFVYFKQQWIGNRFWIIFTCVQSGYANYVWLCKRCTRCHRIWKCFFFGCFFFSFFFRLSIPNNNPTPNTVWVSCVILPFSAIFVFQCIDNWEKHHSQR